MLKQLGIEMKLTEHDYQIILRHIAKKLSDCAEFHDCGMKCMFIDSPMYMLFIDRIDRPDADIKSRIRYYLHLLSSEEHKHMSSAKDYFKYVRDMTKCSSARYISPAVINELNKPEEMLLIEADLDVE